MVDLIMSIVLPIAVAVVPVLLGFVAKFVVSKIKESETLMDDRIGAMAVYMAENAFKGAKGHEKFTCALNWVEDVTNGKVSGEFARGLINASYAKAKPALAKLKNSNTR